jgi:hypothetical protein
VVNLRLETFLLADHAVATSDGKLYIHGGGITRINAPIIPVALPFLSIVLRFRVMLADVGEHTLLIGFQNPQKAQLLPTEQAKFWSPLQMPMPTRRRSNISRSSYRSSVSRSWSKVRIRLRSRSTARW